MYDPYRISIMIEIILSRLRHCIMHGYTYVCYYYYYPVYGHGIGIERINTDVATCTLMTVSVIYTCQLHIILNIRH